MAPQPCDDVTALNSSVVHSRLQRQQCLQSVLHFNGLLRVQGPAVVSFQGDSYYEL